MTRESNYRCNRSWPDMVSIMGSADHRFRVCCICSIDHGQAFPWRTKPSNSIFHVLPFLSCGGALRIDSGLWSSVAGRVNILSDFKSFFCVIITVISDVGTGLVSSSRVSSNSLSNSCKYYVNNPQQPTLEICFTKNFVSYNCVVDICTENNPKGPPIVLVR